MYELVLGNDVREAELVMVVISNKNDLSAVMVIESVSEIVLVGCKHPVLASTIGQLDSVSCTGVLSQKQYRNVEKLRDSVSRRKYRCSVFATRCLLG